MAAFQGGPLKNKYNVAVSYGHAKMYKQPGKIHMLTSS
jgi:hypothetical protein